MKRKVELISHFEVMDFLKRQARPMSVNRIARQLGVSRNTVQVRIDTLTYHNSRIAEDERGRVYVKKGMICE
jgi:DNA-binding IclR family transcriptional regulator